MEPGEGGVVVDEDDDGGVVVNEDDEWEPIKLTVILGTEEFLL